MSIEQLLRTNIDRRQFLKQTGLAAVGLAGLLQGCALTLRETRQEAAQINWDCNPVLTIPAVGCYTGTNLQTLSELISRRFENLYGITPTFHAIGYGSWGASNSSFPGYDCQAAIRDGVVPVIRYAIIPFRGYKPIIQGKNDDDILLFANKVARFESPIVLIPFQHCNDAHSKHYAWAAYPGNEYIDTWVRMHNLFAKEGANKNTVWATKFKMGVWHTFAFLDPFQYCPPKEYIDIIGWNCNNHDKPEIGLYSQSFRQFFDYNYKKASKKYPTKPQMFWELSTARGRKQAEWINQTLIDIQERYPKVKGVMLDEQRYSGIGDSYGSFDPSLNDESIKIVRKHFSEGYFIGSAIKK
jgi:hypothetical protein